MLWDSGCLTRARRFGGLGPISRTAEVGGLRSLVVLSYSRSVEGVLEGTLHGCTDRTGVSVNLSTRRG